MNRIYRISEKESPSSVHILLILFILSNSLFCALPFASYLRLVAGVGSAAVSAGLGTNLMLLMIG